MRANVYFNLHTHLWSMRERSTGLVERHARVVVSALPVVFAVQPAGHARVVETGQKNVHAFVRGDWLTPYDTEPDAWAAFAASLDDLVPVSYNPHRGPSFYRKDTGQDITEAKSVIMLAPVHGPPRVLCQL
jgi:hypothetical protein